MLKGANPMVACHCSEIIWVVLYVHMLQLPKLSLSVFVSVTSVISVRVTPKRIISYIAMYSFIQEPGDTVLKASKPC